MGFDVYSLIQSKEVREYLRKHRKFKALEREVIIRNNYYSIEQKLEFMKRLLTETQEETRGYNVYLKDNAYRMSEKIYADTHYFRSFEYLIKYWESAVGIISCV